MAVTLVSHGKEVECSRGSVGSKAILNTCSSYGAAPSGSVSPKTVTYGSAASSAGAAAPCGRSWNGRSHSRQTPTLSRGQRQQPCFPKLELAHALQSFLLCAVIDLLRLVGSCNGTLTIGARPALPPDAVDRLPLALFRKPAHVAPCKPAINRTPETVDSMNSTCLPISVQPARGSADFGCRWPPLIAWRNLCDDAVNPTYEKTFFAG